MDIKQIFQLSTSIDNAQAYFMKLAERHDEVTFTFKNTHPYVTAFVGKGGPDQKIGFGDSVAYALKDALGF